MTKIFGCTLPDGCGTAIKELKRMKVYREMNDDMVNSFADIWFRVLHECDLYEEGEESTRIKQDAYRSAKCWLRRWEHLYIEYGGKKVNY